MTHSTFRALSLSLSICSALVSACGEPPTDADGFEPSVASDRTIASLSDAEVATYCEESRAYLGRYVTAEEMEDMMCRLFAIAFAPDATTCEQSVVSCAASPPEVTIGCIAEEDRTACDASVEELAACTGDQAMAMDDVRDLLTCDLAGDAAALEELGAGLQPESCQRLFARCPGLQSSMTAM